MFYRFLSTNAIAAKPMNMVMTNAISMPYRSVVLSVADGCLVISVFQLPDQLTLRFMLLNCHKIRPQRGLLLFCRCSCSVGAQAISKVLYPS